MKSIRQWHRWISIVFTLTVITCFIGLPLKFPIWVYYLPLPPIFLLMFSGLYLFVLPYLVKRRRGS